MSLTPFVPSREAADLHLDGSDSGMAMIATQNQIDDRRD